MSKWKECTIGDLGKIVTGKTPRTNISENYGGNIPFLSPSDNMGAKYVGLTNKTISEQGVLEVRNCLIPKGSVCVSCIGSDLGKVLITTKPTITNQQINSIIINEDNDVDFVYYLMTIVGKHLNIISKTSTAIPIVNKSTFSSYKISLPNLDMQKRIAGILSSLDAKIETNRKINARLEELAQALFKSWFIDNAIYNNSTISDYFLPKRGKNLLTSNAISGNVPVVAGGLQPATYHNESNTEAPVITISASGANAGYVNIWGEKVWSSDSSYIDNTLTPYVYFWYNLLKYYQKNIYDSQTGSAQPHIYPKHIGDLRIPDLNQTELKKFEGVVTPIYNRVFELKKESARLAALRDALLPKLMSGEITCSVESREIT